MQRSKLCNLYLDERPDENRSWDKKQIDIFVSLLTKAKRKHDEDLSIGYNTDDKKLWKKVKPLFVNKIKMNPNITLAEPNNFVTNEKSLAETFNDFFVNVVSNPGVNMRDDSSDKGDVSNCDITQA